MLGGGAGRAGPDLKGGGDPAGGAPLCEMAALDLTSMGPALPQLRQPLPGEVDDDELGHMADQAVFNGHLTDRPGQPNRGDDSNGSPRAMEQPWLLCSGGCDGWTGR